MRKLAIAGVVALLAGCSSQPRAPYVPPDTEAGRLRSIAYLPVYGLALDPVNQEKLANDWAAWWNDVYPGTQWISMQATAKALNQANLLGVWSSQEKPYMQSGVFAAPTVRTLCAALATDGILQPVIYHAQAGSGATSFLFRPLFGQGGETAGAGRMGMALISCKSSAVVWQAAHEVSYSGNYTQLQFIEYAHHGLSSKIPTQ